MKKLSKPALRPDRRNLTSSQLAAVAGGLRPQPEPPPRYVIDPITLEWIALSGIH